MLYRKGMGKLPELPFKDDDNLKVYPPSTEVRAHLGTLAIEVELFYLGVYGRKKRVDGIFDKLCETKVKEFQTDEGITSDGIVGPQTLRHLFFHRIDETEREVGIIGNYLFGLLLHESGLDPGIIGGADPRDRGIAQINRRWHPEVSDRQAFDAVFAIPYAGERMKRARQFFSGKGPNLAWRCAIAEYNNPSDARKWFETGKAPNDRIKKYVLDVQAAAKRVPQ